MSDQTSTASAEAPAKAVYLADYQAAGLHHGADGTAL